MSLFQILVKGGIIMIPIGLCSVIALAIIIFNLLKHFISLTSMFKVSKLQFSKIWFPARF